MKKSVFLSIAALLIAFFSFAQDKKAVGILDQMSKKYQNMKTFSADFTYTPEGGRPARGTVITSGDKFKLDIAGQEIQNNGKVIYTYMPEVQEVNVTDYDASQEDMFSPTKIYTLYKQGYKSSYKGEEKSGGRTLEVIELTPTRKQASISKVQLKIDKLNKSINNWKIWDEKGKVTTFKINKFTPNVSAPESLFTFDAKKHPKVEIVDLR